MKICTVTWFNKGMNYGQTLQAYALLQVLEKMGYDAQVLNYRTPFYDYRYSDKRLFFLNRYSECGREQILKQLKFDIFIYKHIKHTELCLSNEDIINVLKKNQITHLICGSDQIWNIAGGLDAVYFLNFGNEKYNCRRISYAASMCSKDAMKSFQSKYAVLNRLISGIDCISVREETAVDIVRELTGRVAEHVLDPTLLLGRKHWLNMAKRPGKKERYMFCYFLGEIEPHIHIINEIAKKKKIDKVISIAASKYENHVEGWQNKKCVSPDEFVGLVDGSDVVCTDSFHGAAFSVNLHKEFYVVDRAEKKDRKWCNGSRIDGLLDKLGISDRHINVKTDLSSIRPINYREVKRQLNAERRRSISFLKNAIEGETVKEVVEKYE